LDLIGLDYDVSTITNMKYETCTFRKKEKKNVYMDKNRQHVYTDKVINTI